MKKKLFVIGLSVMMMVVKPILAQDADPAKNVIKLNLFALGLTDISLQYERSLHKNISVALYRPVLFLRMVCPRLLIRLSLPK
ncbi:MAG: hypothetical protein IT235_00655 [Bacteroidia bacterium]|nr:hypothetical protein [Bacteroidia bacterium]